MLCNVTVLKIHLLELLFKKVVNVPEYLLGGLRKNRKMLPPAPWRNKTSPNANLASHSYPHWQCIGLGIAKHLQAACLRDTRLETHLL